MSQSRRRLLTNRKRRIERRLRDIRWPEQPEPMYTASNIHYELSDRTRGIDTGGIGAMHRLARDTRHLPGGGRMDDPATFYYSEGGGYVVRNDITGDIVAVSDRMDDAWKAPWD